MSDFVVQAFTPAVDQLTAPATDGGSPNDPYFTCGETDVCAIAQRFGVPYSQCAPDSLKDRLFTEAATGTRTDTSAGDIQTMLSWFNLPSTIYQPTTESGSGSFLNLCWQYLKEGRPLIGLFAWIDAGGTVYPNILHWRVVVMQTAYQQVCMDPWGGFYRVEDHDTAWSHFKGYLVGVDQTPS